MHDTRAGAPSAADLSLALAEATVETFEQLAFLFPERGAEDEAECDPATAAADVRFSGPAHGWLRVAVSERLLAEVAANMLGLAGAPSAAEQSDALGEIANVVCGNVVALLAHEGEEPVLSVPEPGAGRALPGEPAAEARFTADGGRIEVFLTLEAA